MKILNLFLLLIVVVVSASAQTRTIELAKTTTGNPVRVSSCSQAQLIKALKLAESLIPDSQIIGTGSTGIFKFSGEWDWLTFEPSLDTPESLRARADKMERAQREAEAANKKRREQITLIQDVLKACDAELKQQ